MIPLLNLFYALLKPYTRRFYYSEFQCYLANSLLQFRLVKAHYFHLQSFLDLSEAN